MASLDATQSVWPGVGGVVVRVNVDQADDGRKLIEDYTNAPALTTDETQTGKTQPGEEPAA